MTVVRLLGTTEVEGQHRVAVRGWRQAGLLVLLCADLGRRISRFRLEDELWGGRSVSEAALRVTVKRLRERFAAAGLEDPIDSGSGGLQLCVDPEDVDLLLFERLVQDGGNAWSKGRSEDARSAVVRALELWVGTPFGELADLPTAAVWAERAARARVDAACVLGSVLLAHDDPGGALGALQCPDDLGYSVSHREDLAELRMLAAGLMGRRDLALGFHRELLEALRSDVGVAPARPVELLRQAIEADDSEALDSRRAELLARAAAPVPLGGAAVDRTRTRSRPSHMPFVGREDVLEQIRAAHHDGRVVLLRGGAGMGKTRIAAEVARSVSEGGGSALLAGASPLEPGPEVVLLPLRELEACSGSNELAAALAAELPRSDTDLHRMRVHDAALAVLGTLPPGSLVVLEDLQWIDIGAAQLVWHLISRSESVSWLLTTRPGPDPEVTGLLVRWLDGASGPGVRELELEAMPDTEIDRIVRDQLGEGFDDSLLRRIVEQSAGWPLLGVELASHFAAGGDADDAPATISQRVESSLVAMDARARSVTELLAVAEVPLELHVLAPDTDVGRLLPELVSSGLVRSEASSVEITHDLLRASIVAGLGGTRLRELHLRSAEVIAALWARGWTQSWLVTCSQPAPPPPRHSTARSDLPSPDWCAGAYDDAATLALEFLAVTGPEATTTDGLASRVQSASVLLMTGRVEEGCALLEAVTVPIRNLGEPVLRADALLARGPVDVGSGDARGLLEESRAVLRLLPPSAVPQRVQLCCWIAHHQLMMGRPRRGEDPGARMQVPGSDVDELLEEAESLTAEAGDPHLRGLVLGIRYQASTSSCSFPEESRSAMDRLRRWAALSGAVSAQAMVRLFELDREATEGTVEGHRSAVESLRELLPAFPRPDVRWYVEAAGAAELLAEGRFEEAAEQVGSSAGLGREMRLGAAEPIERVHQFLLLEGQGLLPALVPAFAQTAERDGDLAVALSGVVSLAAGDRDRAAAMASLLASRDAIVERSGAAWPLVAHLMAELAHGCMDAVLGESVLGSLEHRCGTAASMLGLAMFGSVDRSLGLADLAVGEVARGCARLRSAASADRERGQDHWASVAEGHLAGAESRRAR